MNESATTVLYRLKKASARCRKRHFGDRRRAPCGTSYLARILTMLPALFHGTPDMDAELSIGPDPAALGIG